MGTRNSFPILLLLLLMFVTVKLYAEEFRHMCYYTNWAQYRAGIGKFVPSDIDPKLCSHIFYAFAKIEQNKLTPLEWNDLSTDYSKGMFEKVNDLKRINPKLKTLLSVGGWTMGSAPFTAMVASSSTRKTFIDSSISLLRKISFDGLDIDWEYPAARGGPPSNKQNYVLLVKECKEAFKDEAKRSGKSELLLTAAVPVGKTYIDNGYNVKAIAQHLDFINVMTYDFYGHWDKKTGHNSPLKGSSNNDMLNTEWAINYWIQQGTPKNKVNLGLATYGRSFTLENSKENGLNAPAIGPGKAGEFTKLAGSLAYYEICQMIKKGGIVKRIPKQNMPYMVLGNQWVGYDDEKSVSMKVKWARDFNLGGAFIWDLDFDDFRGLCQTQRYPLLNAMVNAISNVTQGPDRDTSTPESNPTSTPESNPTSKPESKLTSKPESKLTSTPESKSTSKPESKSTSKPTRKPGSKPVSKVMATHKPTINPESKSTGTTTIDVMSGASRNSLLNTHFWQGVSIWILRCTLLI